MDVASHGAAMANVDADYTAQVDVAGLEPGSRYWYGFQSGVEASPVGTFKTLPETTDHIRFAVVSCAKFNAGFFNGYYGSPRATTLTSSCTWVTLASTRLRRTHLPARLRARISDGRSSP